MALDELKEVLIDALSKIKMDCTRCDKDAILYIEPNTKKDYANHIRSQIESNISEDEILGHLRSDDFLITYEKALQSTNAEQTMVQHEFGYQLFKVVYALGAKTTDGLRSALSCAKKYMREAFCSVVRKAYGNFEASNFKDLRQTTFVRTLGFVNREFEPSDLNAANLANLNQGFDASVYAAGDYAVPAKQSLIVEALRLLHSPSWWFSLLRYWKLLDSQDEEEKRSLLCHMRRCFYLDPICYAMWSNEDVEAEFACFIDQGTDNENVLTQVKSELHDVLSDTELYLKYFDVLRQCYSALLGYSVHVSHTAALGYVLQPSTPSKERLKNIQKYIENAQNEQNGDPWAIQKICLLLDPQNITLTPALESEVMAIQGCTRCGHGGCRMPLATKYHRCGGCIGPGKNVKALETLDVGIPPKYYHRLHNRERSLIDVRHGDVDTSYDDRGSIYFALHCDAPYYENQLQKLGCVKINGNGKHALLTKAIEWYHDFRRIVALCWLAAQSWAQLQESQRPHNATQHSDEFESFKKHVTSLWGDSNDVAEYLWFHIHSRLNGFKDVVRKEGKEGEEKKPLRERIQERCEYLFCAHRSGGGLIREDVLFLDPFFFTRENKEHNLENAGKNNKTHIFSNFTQRMMFTLGLQFDGRCHQIVSESALFCHYRSKCEKDHRITTFPPLLGEFPELLSSNKYYKARCRLLPLSQVVYPKNSLPKVSLFLATNRATFVRACALTRQNDIINACIEPWVAHVPRGGGLPTILNIKNFNLFQKNMSQKSKKSKIAENTNTTFQIDRHTGILMQGEQKKKKGQS